MIKSLIINLKLIKALGQKHNSGQLILVRLNTLSNNRNDNNRLFHAFNEDLIANGIDTRYSVIKTLGVRLANYTLDPTDKRLIQPTLNTLNDLFTNFTYFDKYVSYSLSGKSLVYSKVTLAQAENVVDDLIRDCKYFK